jgi:hypothetical protein
VGELKRLRARVSPEQATFHVPPARAADFATALCAAGAGADGARIVIANVVFPARHLNAALGRSDPEAVLARETVVDAGAGEAHPLLTAALGDCVDFWFVPSPGGFLLFADHDEYSTVFAHKKSAVSRSTAALTQAGFRHVSDFSR